MYLRKFTEEFKMSNFKADLDSLVKQTAIDTIQTFKVELLGETHSVLAGVTIFGASSVVSFHVETEYDALLLSHNYSTSRNVKINRVEKGLINVVVYND